MHNKYKYANNSKNTPNKHKQSPEGKTQYAKQNKTMQITKLEIPGGEVCKRTATCNNNQQKLRAKADLNKTKKKYTENDK